VTVYVYRLAGQLANLSQQGWYGLTADTGEELHTFAESMGLKRQFYRPIRSGDMELPVTGHYDLTQAEHDRAVANGAKSISTHEHKKMLDRQAAAFGIKLKSRF
jgi:hypothetical protein